MSEKVANTSTVVTLVLFVVFIIVCCATVIPQLYKIEENTDNLNKGGEVVDGLLLLHEDLKEVITILWAAAGLLTDMNSTLYSMDAKLG